MNKYKTIILIIGSLFVSTVQATQKDNQMQVKFVVHEVCSIEQTLQNKVNVNCLHMTPYTVTQTVMNNPHVEDVRYNSDTKYTVVTITF